jgi:phospholipid/cholesterol/gamma-HCH transport system ATP-binding protein
VIHIACRDLHKRFMLKRVLKGVNLIVNPGETLVIMGQSGCGKSVLLKHVVGLIAPDRGHIYIDGEDITHFRTKKLFEMRMRFGMVFQGAALFDSLTVAENVGLAIREHTNKSENEVDEICEQKLHMVGLSDIGDKRPAELSGGMRKRVGFARAIAMEPECILYDEPTTGLDPIMADVINNLIIKLNDELEITSVVVTHDLASAYKVGDRIAMLHDGRIIFIGTPDEVRNTDNETVRQFVEGSAEGPIRTGNQPDGGLK